MGRTIELSNIKILNWTLDVENKNVTVNYQIEDDSGELYDGGRAIFWENIPEPGADPYGGPGTIPDDWYQLPPGHAQNLLELTVDAKNALLHLLD